MVDVMLNWLLEHIEGTIGGLSTVVSYFAGRISERRKEKKNQIDALLGELDLAYQDIIENTQKNPPNVLSNRYKLHSVERKIKELCKLKEIEVSDIISEHARLSVYATDEQHISPKDVSSQASKIVEKLSKD